MARNLGLPVWESIPMRLKGGFKKYQPANSRFAYAIQKGSFLSGMFPDANAPTTPPPLVPFTPSVTMPEPMAGAPDQQNTLQSLGGAVSRGRRRRGLSIGGVGTFG